MKAEKKIENLENEIELTHTLKNIFDTIDADAKLSMTNIFESWSMPIPDEYKKIVHRILAENN